MMATSALNKHEAGVGLGCGILAYLIWGVLPKAESMFVLPWITASLMVSCLRI